MSPPLLRIVNLEVRYGDLIGVADLQIDDAQQRRAHLSAPCLTRRRPR